MKRVICLILLLTLLCGCTGEVQPKPTFPSVPETTVPVETTESVPALLQNARPWGAEGELLELPLSLTDRLGDISCAMLGNNVLFWQNVYGMERPEGIQFWLLDVVSGEITKTYTHPVTDWSQLQVQSDRICICDYMGGTVTTLDSDLEIQQQWELEPDWRRWFMGSGEKLYIEMGDCLLERDLATGAEREILEGVSGLYVGEITSIGANLSYYIADTERWAIAYLDFASGEVEGAPFRGHFDSCERLWNIWVCRRFSDWRSMRIGDDKQAWDVTIPEGMLSIINEGWLLLHAGAKLSLYASPGYFISSCDIGQGGRYYCVGDPVWVHELAGLIVTVADLETGGSTVLFWDANIGSGADLEMTEVDLSITAEEEMAQLAQQAETLGQKYGLEILIGTDCETDFNDHTALPQTDPEVVREELNRLETILVSFPEGFIPQLYHEDYQRIQIHLVRKLVAKPHYGTGGDYDGVVYTNHDFGGYQMAIDTDGADDKLYYHEFSHIIEDYVSWYCGRYVEGMYFSSGWGALNPEGFSYTYDKANYIDLAEEYYPYFMDNYALINDREDRSRIFEYACTEGSQWMFSEKPGALEKLRFYAEAIRLAFDTTGWPEVTVWEQYLQ